MNDTDGPLGLFHLNFTDQYQESETSDLYVVAKVIRNIYIPLVTLIGLAGNTLSILVFTSRKMKKSSSSVFLAALACVDNIFLVSLVITWIDGEWYQLMRHALACQVVIYTTYVSSFLSVWLVVSFTYERCFAISFPLKIHLLCSVYREKLVVIGLLLMACFLYHFCFWTITTRQVSETEVACSHKFEYFQFLTVATWLDTALTLVIPFFAILFGNIKVVIHVIRCSMMAGRQIKRKHYYTRTSTTNGRGESAAGRAILHPDQRRYHGYESVRVSKRSPQMRVTRTLLLVSTTFLVLNLPSHIVRLYSIILTISASPDAYTISSPALLFVKEITYLLYYTTFSCNFILYAICGRNFQRVLGNLMACKSHKDVQREIMLGKLSSGHCTVAQL